MSDSSPTPDAWPHALARVVAAVLAGLHWIAAAAVVIVFVAMAVPYTRQISQPAPLELPPTMEAVDWNEPNSSVYCLACHQQVGLAAGGVEVERGHAQNVALQPHQVEAVTAMGTFAGEGDTLICMSCHQLGGGDDNPHMLAGTLEDSRLCQQCHPGHYAQGTPHDLRLSAPDKENRIGETVAEGGPCSACHLAHKHALELQQSPLDPEGYCLPCHSEYGVAAAHARTTNDHPESVCRECHDPHDSSNGAFLSEPIDDLCVRCHEGFGDGLAGGMHPIGPMDEPVPQELIEAHAHTLNDPKRVTCVVCHDTHVAEHPKLLHMTADENRLCLTCHEDKLLEHTHDQILPRHGQQPVLDEAQQAVVAEWGNPVGPNGELLCISCHGVHNAVADTQLLSFRPKYGETCSACHPAHEGVIGSPHDLRIEHADLPNSAGLLPSEAGVCSACHMAHRFPRERVVTPGDPGGQCATCHRQGDCAQDKLTGGNDHPDTACIECHNPHERRYGNFLIAPPEKLCLSCHEDQARAVGGPHDLATNPDAWPEEAVAAGGPCLSCHVPHGGEHADLYRFRTPTGFGNHDGVCMTCHVDTAWDADSLVAAIHPRKIDEGHHKVDLALVPTDVQGDKRIGCRTCHDPHGGAKPVHLARVEPDEPTEMVCIACHTEKRLLQYTGHSPDSLLAAGYRRDSCKPCHAMHADPTDKWGELLSPRFLMDECEVDMENVGQCLPCQACHRTGGPGPQRAFAQHSEVMTQNVFTPDDPGYMPLFGRDGKIDEQGQVTCRTCHISHGRDDLLRLIESEQELTASQRDAVKAQLRPYEPPNMCTTCHGPQARLLFLFFHDPHRRPPVEVIREAGQGT